MLERIAGMDNPTYGQLDSLIEEHRAERLPEEPTSSLVGDLRIALDSAFRHDSVEVIVQDLKLLAAESDKEDIRQWAKGTLNTLALRSPTSLKVALMAVRRGKSMTLLEALQMEMNIATAFCVSRIQLDPICTSRWLY